METGTINTIREKRDSLREKIKVIDLKRFSSNTFGDENEYSFKGLVAGIEALLTDLSTLTKTPSKFIKISTYAERNNIISYYDYP